MNAAGIAQMHLSLDSKLYGTGCGGGRLLCICTGRSCSGAVCDSRHPGSSSASGLWLPQGAEPIYSH